MMSLSSSPLLKVRPSLLLGRRASRLLTHLTGTVADKNKSADNEDGSADKRIGGVKDEGGAGSAEDLELVKNFEEWMIKNESRKEIRVINSVKDLEEWLSINGGFEDDSFGSN